ncbi:MAG: phosphoglucosamine mutase [Chitinivibrionia bacterium]|nr:phosphoglucosamine mutase [Chitinivibrionia bacterium]
MEKPIMSVSGIRGRFGEGLTLELLRAIAYIQTKHSNGAGKKVIIGRDTRPSGEKIQNALCQGIRAAGGIPISIGIATTPTTCFAVKHFGAAAGIIITASHNPHPYNGYKAVHTSGRLFNADECNALYEDYNSGNYLSDKEFNAFSASPEIIETTAVSAHIAKIVENVDVETIKAAKIKVAVDAINGAASGAFPQLLAALGVKYEGIHCKTDGDFVHNPEPRPAHLGDLEKLLKSESDFWGGFAFDPDGDRLVVMGENGEPICEEMTLALSMMSILASKKSDVATNLSTSMVIDDVAKNFGVKVIRTKIGEANVVDAIRKNDLLLGGEGNGGVIYPAVSMVRDGLVGLALIIECMAKNDKKITRLTSEYKEYPIVKEKISIVGLNPIEVLSKLAKIFADEKIDTQDGLKIIYNDGWVHIRSSNTEPIMRVYAEGITQEKAEELAKMVMDRI